MSCLSSYLLTKPNIMKQLLLFPFVSFLLITTAYGQAISGSLKTSEVPFYGAFGSPYYKSFKNNSKAEPLLKLDSISTNSLYTYSYHYDENGRLIQSVSLQNGVPSTKVEYFYAGDNVVLRTESTYSSFMDAGWTTLSMWQFNYNISNGQLSEMIYFFITTDYATDTWYWEKGSKNEFITDADSVLQERNFYFWDKANNEWYLHRKSLYSHSDSLYEDLTVLWDSVNLVWVDETLVERHFDANGLEIAIVAYEADSTGWNYERKYEFGYDAYGNKIEILDYLGNNNQWELFSKRTTSYNYSYTLPDLVLPPGISEPHKITEDRYYSWTGTDWLFEWERTYHYSNFGTTSINEEVAKTTVNIYPNPAQDFINIELPQTKNNAFIKIYDIYGRLILSQQLQSFTQISLDRMSAGIYIYNIYSEGSRESGRIIKK